MTAFRLNIIKKGFLFFLCTAMISLQAKNYEFNPNVYGFEENPSGYSLNPFNFINNNSAFIDIDFGTVADFMLFTGNGAIGNTGISTITGNIGSNVGEITGFGAPSVVNGVIENSNAVTTKAYEDLKVACAQLDGLTKTVDHIAGFGNPTGETIGPGVYSINSAVEITGTLILDAQGDPDAMFIFKIYGALNSVAASEVLLINKASAANVYWYATGAIGFGANTTMVGTAIADTGAVSLGAGGSITGSLYTTVGSISTDSFEASIPVRDPAYNYLGAYTSNGTPLYLEDPSDNVSAATQKTINTSLPDNYPVPEYNPQYITSSFDTNLKIEGSTDVLVTFVSEGVDAKNALGFYTYDINNPSATIPTKDDITIIFPNVSGLSSGGSLQVGDKVNIGSFEAGTGIGWVLIADAWNSTDQEVGDSARELYSNPNYNPETDASLRLHNVLLEDTVNERIILGFEDVLRDDNSCDNDFNDAVFYITASAYQEINTNNFVDITSAFDTFLLSDSALKVGEIATVTLTFSEVVNGFSSDYITAVNGTLSTMTTVDNRIWTGTFTPFTNIEDATNILTLNTSNTVFEGITVLSTTTSNYEVDTLFPTVLSFVLSNSALKAGETATVTLTFSEAVAGFSSDTDITAVNGTLSSMTTGNNIIWTGTFTPTVDTEDASNVLTLSANYTDLAVNAGPSDTTSNYEVETLLPTADITYNSISPYKSGETIVITATFNEALLDSPVPQIDVNSSGITSGNATNMTKTSATTYTYNYVVPAGDGTRTISLSNGKDLVGNVITSTPTSGTTFMLDNTMPTASLAYMVEGTAVSSVSANDVVTITATFNENIADSPGMQISGSGVETISATNMTKVSATSYTYAWTMGTGAGTQTFALGAGIDIAGNVVTATPTSGAIILIDAPQHLTKYGKISIGSADLINKYGALGGTSGLTVSGKRISISTAPDGLTSATASSSAYQIKQDFPDSTDGLYWIANSNINSGAPFQIYADMTTDGGGWTLVLNYLHKGGTNPALAVKTNSFPIQASTTLGTDESAATKNWGHLAPATLNAMPFTQLRFYGKTSFHTRIIHFRTTHANTIAYFKTGTGSMTGIYLSYTALTDHTANLPESTTNYFTSQGNEAMTNFSFWRSGSYHWGIRGMGQRWEVDDYANNAANHTFHQIWVK
jgi:hypothetical protein